MQQTVINDISGDQKLEIRDQYIWMMRNVALYFEAEKPLPNLGNFRCANINYPGSVITFEQSPPRVLCNLFFQHLPKAAIRSEIGNIDVLDIGCGSGKYFAITDRFLGGLRSYVGSDIYRNKSFDAISDVRARFIISDAENLGCDLIENSNFIISVSVLEHIRYDLTAMQNIAAILYDKVDPTIQVHLLPPAFLYRQYGPHGYRGYNSAAIKKITDIYDGFSDIAIYTLGGSSCNEVHFDWFFDVFDRKKAYKYKLDPDGYNVALSSALVDDMEKEYVPVRDACFIAIVIHTHPKTRIFG